MKYPVITTRGVIVFPNYSGTIDVGRKKSLVAIEIAAAKFNDELIFVSQKDIAKNNVESKEDIFTIGTLVKITSKTNLDGDAVSITVKGLKRIKLKNPEFSTSYISSEISVIRDTLVSEEEEKKLVTKVSKALETIVGSLIKLPRDDLSALAQGVSAKKIVQMLGTYMPIEYKKKQELLEEPNIGKALNDIILHILEIQNVSKIDKDIDKTVYDTIDGQQKEFLLRERMKAIKEKLGEISSKDAEIDEWKEKLKDDRYPKEVRDRVYEEITKYEAIPPISSESNVIRTYIDWLITLPWKTFGEDNKELEEARKILDKHHYGIKEVKERIVEYLAVKINTDSSTSPILTLLGPPGVGKTSLAKSIGEAVGREVVKVSLGGLRDESEIRGHRRTYIGAMPGKIIQAIKKAKTSNPVILLDEIDKMSSDYRGDPTSAMLEVLDPEQNKQFQDHYLELEYDLSQVMFVATANFREQIPGPLLDRVEILQLDQYTSEEKLAIAKLHIVPSTIKDHGLAKSDFKLSDGAISFIIEKYTLEAGVRGLQRAINKLARKVVVRKLTDKKEKFVFTLDFIIKLLGKEKVHKEQLEGKAEIGLVNGMYYSSVGGGVLPIEVTIYPSKKGDIKITGSIKDVMKESLSIAIGYIRANQEKLGISFDFETNMIHVHVPEGATPKDGPSAGTAFTTALISALTKKPVAKNIALTGEITLRGKVLPIGGLKEKSIGAVEAGVRKIFIPKSNMKDVDELAEKVKELAEIIPVENYDQIFENIFK